MPFDPKLLVRICANSPSLRANPSFKGQVGRIEYIGDDCFGIFFSGRGTTSFWLKPEVENVPAKEA